MILDADQVRRRYDRTARFYNPSLVLYRIIGLTRQRKQSVELLNLGVGDTAIDLGCGTGANLPMRRAGRERLSGSTCRPGCSSVPATDAGKMVGEMSDSSRLTCGRRLYRLESMAQLPRSRSKWSPIMKP